MQVPGVGAGPTGTELPGGWSGLAGPAGRGRAALTGAQSGDAITALLRDLSELEFVRLLEFIERPPPPENAARLEGLLQASVSAAAKGNAQEALVKLAEFAALDPRRAETLDTEPGLASIRADVRELLFRLASAARLDAASRLGQATHLLQAAGSQELPGQEIRPQVLILMAGRLLESGGYSNCARSKELSQAVINLYGYALTPAPLFLTDPKSTTIRSAQIGWWDKWMPRIKRLWTRAPLLVLLLAWLAVGLVAGSLAALLRSWWPQTWPESPVAGGFEFWGLGFLVLILFGFYARIRDLLR